MSYKIHLSPFFAFLSPHFPREALNSFNHFKQDSSVSFSITYHPSMAVHSTLCSQSSETNINHLAEDATPNGAISYASASFTTHAMGSETSLPSILHTDEVALPVGPLFGNNYEYNVLPPATMYSSYADHNLGAPVDGETVWYCSACGDGPYGSWQDHCQNCTHAKCTSCRVENTK